MLRARALTPPAIRLRVTLLIIAMMGCVGCSPSGQMSDSQSPPARSVATTVDIDEAETWDVIRMAGQSVGYQVTRWQRRAADGISFREISAESRLKLRRFGQVTEETMTIVSRETLDGELLSFSTQVSSGSSPIVTTGSYSNGQLELETSAGGETQAWTVAVPGGCGGLFALESNLHREPMQSGETRLLTAFVPVLNVASSVELRAEGLEVVSLVGQSQKLLHVVSETTLAPGQMLQTDLWCDSSGQILKSQAIALQQETYRVEKHIALSEVPGGFDLGDASIVRLDTPLPSSRETRQIRYIATLRAEDPSQVFVERPYQRVTPIDERRAEILVTAIRPTVGVSNGSTTRSVDHPQATDREPSAIIQSSDPLIKDLASQVVIGADDPWSVAVAIERFVHDYVTEKNFSTAFASAREVAKSKSGDCTEHAVLTAAICRASGIPARLAVGLVYVPPKSGFGFHMWNEVWVEDEWIPIDATIGRGGIGADHLVLATTSFDAKESFSSFLPVIQTIGQLELQVTEVDSNH